MHYDEVSEVAKSLGYRDKLRLAQLMIQLARREVEDECPERDGVSPATVPDADYVARRVRKLKPRTRTALLNSIEAMFQFRGGIAVNEKERLVAELDGRYGIGIDQSGRVSYSD